MLKRLVLSLGLLGATAVAVQGDATAEELKKLQGTWVVKSATHDGKPANEMKMGHVVFSNDQLTVQASDGKTQKYTFKIGLNQKPKVMELIPEKAVANAAAGNVIYELDGDNLKICIAPPDRRPTEFTDKGAVLILLTRKKS
jgi:uncharacterized protein (TIGR03067 family)